MLRNPSAVTVDLITNTILDQLAQCEYPITAHRVQIVAGAERFKQFERTCLALSSIEYPYLSDVYLTVHVKPERKTLLLLGLSLIRVSGVKFLCNQVLGQATKVHWGLDDNFDWTDRTKVWGLVQEFLYHVLTEFFKSPKVFLEAMTAMEGDFPVVAGFREVYKTSTEEKERLEKELRTLENMIRELEQESREAHEQQQTCEKTRETTPPIAGWGTFAGFTLLALFTRSGIVFALGLLMGIVAFVVALIATSSELRSAKDSARRIWQTLNQARAELAETEQELLTLRSGQTASLKSALDEVAKKTLGEEERWFVQGVTDSSLERFVQLSVSLVNEVQASLFPNTPPFKDYE